MGEQAVKVPQIQFYDKVAGQCQFLDDVMVSGGWGAATLSRWYRLCAGAACESWRLLENFPLLRCLLCRVVRTWKSGHFSFALVCQLVVACGCCLWSTAYWISREILRAPHLVQQCIHVLREALEEITYFLRCGELEL